MSGPLRVLVVEDNEDHARLACEFLHVSGEFVTEIAGDLQALWARLAEAAYDVITLDYNLPDGNGLKALQELSARGHDCAVVMVTGRGDERVAAQAIQHGALEYVVKTGDYLGMLAAVVQKAARTHALMTANRRSLEQIRYQALLLNNVHDAVVVWDLDGRITFWNRAAEQLYGWAAAVWLGQQAAECYQTLFEPAPEWAALAARAPQTVERHGRHRTGAAFWVSSSLTPLEDAAGQIVGVMDVARDITARKRLEEQVLAAQTQLAQAARLAAIGELASGVAHQISNPLTTIIAETQLLRRELTDSAAQESLQAIERGGWRAQEAVQRLLDFSRPAAAEREPLALNATIEHALALVGGLIEANGVRLRVQLAPDLPPVTGIARQLEDVWVNLLLLARDGTDDGGAHQVSVSSELAADGQVRVVIADDGRPVPAERLAGLFEPDYTGAPSGRGTGLEPSICREIVRQHAGAISAACPAGQGLAFTVLLPAR